MSGWKTNSATLVAIIYLFARPQAAPAQNFCSDLKEVLRAADQNYLQIRGRFTRLPLGMMRKSEGWISTKTLSGFDVCAIRDNEYGCLGADQLDGDHELSGKYSEVSNNISDCLRAKFDRDRGWRVSQGDKFSSTGHSMQVWTNGGHFDRQGRETHIRLEIKRRGSANNLYKLGCYISRY